MLPGEMFSAALGKQLLVEIGQQQGTGAGEGVGDAQAGWVPISEYSDRDVLWQDGQQLAGAAR